MAKTSNSGDLECQQLRKNENAKWRDLTQKNNKDLATDSATKDAKWGKTEVVPGRTMFSVWPPCHCTPLCLLPSQLSFLLPSVLMPDSRFAPSDTKPHDQNLSTHLKPAPPSTATSIITSPMFLERLKAHFAADPPVQSRLDGMRTCVYYSNWSVYSRNHFPDQIPVSQTTNVFYAFFNVDPSTGEVKLSDAWADVEMPLPAKFDQRDKPYNGLLAKFFEIKRHNRHVKVSMSIGGWSNRHSFRDAVSNDLKMDKFAYSATALMMEYGLDGIDLDWEYPETAQESLRYLQLMKRLRKSLRALERVHQLPKDTFLLTIASPAFAEKLSLWNIKEMDKCLSFWNLMAYDFAGEWSGCTGYHCNLFAKNRGDLCGDDGVRYLIKRGVEPAKLVLGMANYGRSFTNTYGLGHPFHGVGPGSSDEQGIWNYNQLPLKGVEESYDPQAVCAFAYNHKTRTFVSYDNPMSVARKGEYVHRMNLGGGMWWESCGDAYADPERSLIHSFVKALGGTKVLDRSENVVDAYAASDYLKQ